MAAKPYVESCEVVIIGNGPSALILSYLLHGNIPYYRLSNSHPDPILHSKLVKSPCLLDIDVPSLTAHFNASRLSYSTQALPINVLLDTLIRPLADTEPGSLGTCVEWRYDQTRAVPHVVLGNTAQAGGQWADNPVAASWDIGALSYAEMLALPGYSFVQHQKAIGKKQAAEFYRPTRREVADYLAAYPNAVGIADSIRLGTTAEQIVRTADGFYIASQGLQCKFLALASGIFSNLLPARPQLQPLLRLPDHSTFREPPLLVVGSGFTAADIIITNLPKRKIIHIFKWSPEERPSPLRACHVDAYPDYAGVYRRMKIAAIQTLDKNIVGSPPPKKQKGISFFEPRDWDESYEGLPNTYIKDVTVHGEYATVSLEAPDGRIIKREVSNLEYVIGRRGSLGFLDEALQKEVLSDSQDVDRISGKSLRSKVENTLEVASNVFVIGSLTGDSLIRFAYGGCIYAAREIGNRRSQDDMPMATAKSKKQITLSEVPNGRLKNGNGHTRMTKVARSNSMDLEIVKSSIWRSSGWWSGIGIVP
jgi:hypothetical protein